MFWLVFNVLLALSLIVVTGVVYQGLGAARDRKRFPAPGQLVDLGDCRLHLHESGHGTPTVILEAGIAASSLSWSHVQPLIAKFTQVASYDRAGLGWSKGGSAVGLARMTQRLNSLLMKTGLTPPYILVGHSFGGLLIRAFAHAHPDQVAGLVFIDPVSITAWADCSGHERRRLATGAKLARRGSWLTHLGVVRIALTGASRQWRVTETIASVSAGKGTSTLQRLAGEIQKLPAEVLPAVRSHWSRAKCFTAMAEHLEGLPACASEAATMAVSRDIPVVVLSAATATPEELQERDTWVNQSSNGRHSVIENTGHWLHLERPEVVAAVVEELTEAWRATASRRLREAN